METCYKAFRTPLLKSIPLRSQRFGFEPEITTKLAKRQARIYETPISYNGRTYEEGKKIGLSVHSKLTSQIRCNGVIPFRQCVAVFEAKRGDQTRVGFEPGRILFPVQIGSHNQASFGTGSADEVEHLFIAVQWLGSPVLGDL